MSDYEHVPSRTGLLLVDPYNDYLSDGGKLWPRVRHIATEVRLLENLRAMVRASRANDVRIFHVPHRRREPGDYLGWDHPSPSQCAVRDIQTFARGSWGGEWHPDLAPQSDDVVVKEHWAQRGFANTDLDLQLKPHNISHVIAVGLLANTCIESTGRFAMELGYHVTLVRDGTAAFTREMMHAAHHLNGPTFAHAILSTAQLISALQQSAERVPTTSP